MFAPSELTASVARPLKSCEEGITLVDIGLFSISTTSVLVKIRNARKVIE